MLLVIGWNPTHSLAFDLPTGCNILGENDFCSRIGQEVIFIVEGYHVCKTAWMAAHGVGEKMFKRTFQFFSEGFVVFETETDGKLSAKSMAAKSWMKLHFSRIGDIMPDSLTIHLPSYLDCRMLHNYMKSDFEKQGEECISYSQFCSLFKSHFPDVRIPKVCLQLVPVFRNRLTLYP